MKKILAIVSLVFVSFALLSSDININWQHGGSSNSISGYNIYYGVNSRSYTNFVTTGYVTNTVISNLPANSIVYVSGTSIGISNLQSEFGNEVTFVTAPTSNGLPSFVKNFMVTKVTRTIY